MDDEIFNVVTREGLVVGKARRSEVHGNPGLIHQTVHCLVFNSKNELYLQKRSLSKDVQPGKWDTSVGGHLMPEESALEGIQRETSEELSISGAKFTHLYRYLMSNAIETELVDTYKIIYDGPIRPNPEEISEGRFWKPAEIESALDQDIFTPNFVEEWNRYNAMSETNK